MSAIAAKRFAAALCIVQALLAGCALLPVPESSYFSDSQRQILERTTRAIDFGYGYDTDVMLNYVFPFAGGDIKTEAREKDFAAAVRDVNEREYLAFYEKLYRLRSLMHYKLEHYRTFKSWTYYTYLNNYLLPPFEKYHELALKQLLDKNPSIEDKLPGIRSRIDREVNLYFMELERERENFYY